MSSPGILLALALAPASAAPSILGFNFPAWWHDSYKAPKTLTSLERLAETGANWVAITPTWYMKDKSASNIASEDGTASDESLRTAIRKAKALGLKVALKPHVDEKGGGPRSMIRAGDPESWFADYRRMTLHYAKLGAEERVELFVVGTELFRMSADGFEAPWRRVIREVRAEYQGPLTYAANWYDFHSIAFWDALDLISVDAYFPLALGPWKGALRNAWNPYLPLLRRTAAAHGKPILFTEIGCAAQRGAPAQPWAYWVFGPLDVEIQKTYAEVLTEVFDKETWFSGFLWWAWEVNPDAGGPKDKSMTVQGKPALETLKAYFKKTAPPPPAPLPADRSERALQRLETPRFDGR